MTDGCRHTGWQFPDPLPGAGAECDECGARYSEPTGTVNGVPWRDLDPDTRETIRALAQIRALDEYQYAETTGKRAVGNAKSRIVATMGWTEPYADLPD